MSTANFYTQKNFDLYIQSFEPISMEEYQADYFMDDDYTYPEYEAIDNLDWKNELLEKSYSETMEIWQETFYDDLFQGYNGFKDLMEDFNDTLTFHKITFKSGYYDGVQLYVEEKDNPHELDNDDCHYYYDMCRSKAIRKYEAEIRKINKWMEKVAKEHGWQKIYCLGVASNGEAFYQYAEN